MNINRILLLRYDWEQLVHKFNFPNKKLYHGTIESLEWFLKNGRKSNSLRPRFTEARIIAKLILRAV